MDNADVDADDDGGIVDDDIDYIMCLMRQYLTLVYAYLEQKIQFNHTHTHMLHGKTPPRWSSKLLSTKPELIFNYIYHGCTRTCSIYYNSTARMNAYMDTFIWITKFICTALTHHCHFHMNC